MFDIKINGDVVKSIDVDPMMVQAIVVSGQRIPVQTEEIEIDISIEFRSPRDGEVIERFNREAINQYVAEQDPLASDEVKDLVTEQNERTNPTPEENKEDENGSDLDSDLGSDSSGGDSGDSEGLQSDLEDEEENQVTL